MGTWNVRSMNQGKMEVVKQELARVNINILGISELKWTGMGEFNSDDHYIYYCGQESLRRNGVAIIVNKSPKCSTWMQSQKQQNDLPWTHFLIFTTSSFFIFEMGKIIVLILLVFCENKCQCI